MSKTPVRPSPLTECAHCDKEPINIVVAQVVDRSWSAVKRDTPERPAHRAVGAAMDETESGAFAGQCLDAKIDTHMANHVMVFRRCLSEFQPVLHLLGARFVRFSQMPVDDLNTGHAIILISDTDQLGMRADESTGYSPEIDVLFFAQEANALQQELRRWSEGRKPQSKLLGDEMFEFDSRWAEPPRRPGWPDTGIIAIHQMESVFIPSGGRPGRPKKTLCFLG
jgi:hypothetical protein